MKRFIAMLIALAMLAALAACTNSGGDADPAGAPEAVNTAAPADSTEAPIESTQAPAVTVAPDGAEYTYRLSMASSPINWNPLEYQTGGEATLLRYIESPLIDVSIADDGVNFTWVFEMASSLEDVTATYADRERWLEPDEDGELPTEWVIYRIGLNPDAKWEDGTPITAETYIYSMKQLLSIPNYRGGASRFVDDAAAIKNAGGFRSGRTGWEDVGLIAEDDFTLIYINENPVSEFTMKSALTTNWIVYEPLYEAGSSVGDNGLVTNDYGTSLETTMSCGPYKLVSCDSNGQFVLELNECWYGRTDGRHVGQYQATRVVFSIIPDHEEALAAFLRGELDEVALTADDLAEYGLSDALLKAEEPYLSRFVFASDLDKLYALEEAAGDGANKRVLYYDDFRKAISLSIDREEFCAYCTAAFKPAYFLLNSMFYCDIEHDPESQYRNTKEGREAVLRLYGVDYGPGTEFADDVEAYASVTGYDVEAARALFQSVYEQAVADGNYTDGQDIRIRCEVTSAQLSEEDIRQQDYLNRYAAAAASGTGFEGRISFEFCGNAENRFNDIASGRIEMIRAEWGGAAYYPFSVIRCYCEPDHMGGLHRIQESCGWDPAAEPLTIPINGRAETDTIQQWAKAINEGGRYSGKEYAETKITILSYIESAILSSYQCIPVGSRTSCRLVSKKISYGASEYNIMYGWGGVRLMTFNCNDAEWEEFVAAQGG